ncbi:MAG: hypothetical protein J5752_00915 [Clostridiales bacterium]|nr:hypothetical protein [Clostridiales bacterium]
MKKNSSSSKSNNASKAGKNYAKTVQSKQTAYEPDFDALGKMPDIKASDMLLRVLVLLVPALVAILSGLVLKDNIGDFFTWWAAFYLYSWAAFPIVAYFFRGFVSTGYGLAKSLGILLTTGPVWLISYLGIWDSFNRPMTIIMFIALIAVSWGIPKTRRAAMISLCDNKNISHIILEEAIFTVFFVFLLFCKGIFPNINGEEKFMNFGFMNSMVRDNSLPAKDPWLAGHSINYYYYGQYVFSYLTKMLGTKTGIAYNISMCAAIAIPFSSAFTLGQLFIDGLMQKRDCPVSKWYLPFAGLLSSACALVFGNSHSFFYDEQSFGNKMLFWKIWEKLGINVGSTTGFFYPDSTRFIGHNPDLVTSGISEVGDYTIHEFPFYSYLIGDLHAHVVSMMIVLLIIGFVFVAVFRAKYDNERDQKLVRFHGLSSNLVKEMRHLCRPEFFFAAYLLGLAQMCNYWDFLIYFIFCSMGLLVYHARRSTYLCSFTSLLVFFFEAGGILGVYLKFGSNVYAHLCLQFVIFVLSYLLTTIFPTALSRTGLGMSMLFTIASFISMTFNLNFDMISNSIALVDRHTSLFQFTIVWLIHILIPLALVVLVIATKRHKYKKNLLPVLPAPLSFTKPAMDFKKERAEASEAVEAADASDNASASEDAEGEADSASSDPDADFDPDVVVAQAHIHRAKSKSSDPDLEENSDEDSDPSFIARIALLFRTLDYYLAKFGDFLLCKFFRLRSIVDIFMVGMTFVGFMMLIAPEIIYVRDIYGKNYQRSNTMFKFTFAGFIILSLVIGYTVFRFMAHVTRKGNLSNWGLTVSIIMIVLIIFIPGHYTLRSLDQRCGEIKMESYKTLDGTAYLSDYKSPYWENDHEYADEETKNLNSYEGNLVSYQEAIDWLNTNVKGSRNICEAKGLSYTDKCIVSAYTGLPTIIGWQTHEWLWHFQGIVDENGEFVDAPGKNVWENYISPRYADLETIYTSGDVEEVRNLLHIYDVTYVICGQMELSEMGVVNYSAFDEIGNVVFTSTDGSLKIYQVQ